MCETLESMKNIVVLCSTSGMGYLQILDAFPPGLNIREPAGASGVFG